MIDSKCSICYEPVIFWTKKGAYSIFECPTCGFGQVLPKLTLADIHVLYDQSGHDSQEVKRKNVELPDVLNKEKEYPNSTIDAKNIFQTCLSISRSPLKSLLDIGAGYGFFSHEFLKQGFKVDAIEMAANEGKIFKELNGFEPYNCAFEEYKTDKLYSHILMSQILEHVIDPEDWIKRANALLEKEGLLIIALPNFGSIFKKVMHEKEPFIIPPYHLNYFTKKSLSQLLERNGFDIIEYKTISRLPFKKIFSKFPTPVVSVLTILGNIVLKVIDFLSMGAIINVYARKK